MAAVKTSNISTVANEGQQLVMITGVNPSCTAGTGMDCVGIMSSSPCAKKEVSCDGQVPRKVRYFAREGMHRLVNTADGLQDNFTVSAKSLSIATRRPKVE
jgi:hypothetical protein